MKKIIIPILAFSVLVFIGLTVADDVVQTEIDVPDTYSGFEKVIVSAHEGDETAQFLLGFLYWYGSEDLNLGKNKERGMYWIEKAAEQGYTDAQDFLSGRYAFGDDKVVNQSVVISDGKSYEEQHKSADD